MTQSLFTPSWYRVAHLKPTIKRHCQTQRRLYRGELWYILTDPVSGKHYRFSPQAYQLIGLMDGERSVQELWDFACRDFSDEAPTQPEVVSLLGQLYSADILSCDVPPDTGELLMRGQKIKRDAFLAKLRGGPLFMRLPLGDPEKFLTKTQKLADLCFSRSGLLIWAATIIAAAIMLLLHWSEFTNNSVDRLLGGGNLLILFLLYPLLKGLHELGHGYAVKRWGGEVHEIGVMLLVFMPVPYIDASSSSAFRQRWQRLVVSGAGIAVELFFGALAALIWVSIEPGVTRAIAYNIILVGGVSTLLFNGNPLLRYDGYYLLSDLLDIPNLAQRSRQYLGWLSARYIFDSRLHAEPYCGPGEQLWLIAYGLLSFAYRICVYLLIIYFVAGKFFFLGVLIAAWGAITMFVLPTTHMLNELLTGMAYQDKRTRVIAVLTSLLFFCAALLFVVPLPHFTNSEGVTWIPEQGLVRTKTSGIVERIVAPPNAFVRQGDVLIECRDSSLEAEAKILTSQMREFESRYQAAYVHDQIEAKIIAEDLAALRQRVVRVAGQLQGLTITSPTNGHFVVPGADDMAGRFLKQGELVGYVLQEEEATVRIVVPQDKIDLVRKKTKALELRVATRPDKVVPGHIIREVPGAVDRLPSTVLSRAGGGDIVVDPLEESGKKMFTRMFQFDVAFRAPSLNKFRGSRVYVRFDHGWEPIAFRCYRALRQLFLKRFNA